MSYNDLSGIILNQNAVPEGSASFVPLTTSYFYQTFRLPTNYKRGSILPPFTGFQVCVTVADGYQLTATLDWTLDHYVELSGWSSIAAGTTVGTAFDGDKVWFTVYLTEPVAVQEDWIQDQFRIGVKSRSGTGGTFMQPVEYDGTFVTINGFNQRVVPDISSSTLMEGHSYPFTFAGIPSLLYVEPGSGQVYYSIQQGVTKWWYTAPNPLATSFGSKGFTSNGTTPVLDTAREVSFLFRILAAVADEGTDFLGNSYRSAIITNGPENLQALDANGSDRYWMSKPNPSRFGVESLYFDVSNSGEAVVVDRILMDPLTPGVFFNVYYSNDPSPGHDIDSWDNLMWRPVNRIFQMNKAEVHALPAPITCKYIKIEFVQLQARYYSPGNFQQPIVYRKHPKWVLDYFLLLYISAFENPFIGSSTTVIYDALDLAYGYYVDDINQSPDRPDSISEGHDNDSRLTALLAQENDSVGVDASTLNKIRIAFQPFLNSTGVMAKAGSLIGSYLSSTATNSNSVTEVITTSQANTSVVSSENRESLVIEKNFPVMNFYIECRHGYRESSAVFAHDRAYFAGVKQISFSREIYSNAHDNDLYIDRVGDNVNTERNDFVLVDQALVTYASS